MINWVSRKATAMRRGASAAKTVTPRSRSRSPLAQRLPLPDRRGTRTLLLSARQMRRTRAGGRQQQPTAHLPRSVDGRSADTRPVLDRGSGAPNLNAHSRLLSTPSITHDGQGASGDARTQPRFVRNAGERVGTMRAFLAPCVPPEPWSEAGSRPRREVPMAPGGVEPPHAASKAAALSAELRGLERKGKHGARRARRHGCALLVEPDTHHRDHEGEREAQPADGDQPGAADRRAPLADLALQPRPEDVVVDDRAGDEDGDERGFDQQDAAEVGVRQDGSLQRVVLVREDEPADAENRQAAVAPRPPAATGLLQQRARSFGPSTRIAGTPAKTSATVPPSQTAAASTCRRSATKCTGGEATSGLRCPRAVAVAQLVEPRVVVPVVAGSGPVRHLPLARACGAALRSQAGELPVSPGDPFPCGLAHRIGMCASRPAEPASGGGPAAHRSLCEG